MGEIVRQHSLGLTVDSAVTEEITQGLTRLLSEAPEECCNLHKMEIFARQNSAANFAYIIFQHILTIKSLT